MENLEKIEEMQTDTNECSSKKRSYEEIAPTSTKLKRRKLDFDFWKAFGARSESMETQKVDVSIIDITNGLYLQSRITCRVSLKQRVRNSKYGKVFVFHGIDDTDEIAFVSFREVAEKLEPLLELNKVYFVENFKAKLENSEMRSSTGHRYEIMLDSDSIVTSAPSMEDTIRNIPVSLENEELAHYPAKSYFDFAGILVKDFGVQTGFNGKTKRDLLFYAKSKDKILCTLWDVHANDFQGKEKNPFFIRKGVVAFDSESIHVGRGTLLWENPPYDASKQLLEWFNNELESRMETA